MKAMVLAAGRGSRLRPLTDELPKPLLPIAGRPLISYQLEALGRAGFTEVVVNVAYKAEMITAALGDGSEYGVSIHYSHEEEGGLETGGGIMQALPMLGERFVVVSGDIYTEFPYASLREQPTKLAHLVMVDPLPKGGDFGLNGIDLSLNDANMLTYANIGVFHRDMFEDFSQGFFPLVDALRPAIDRGRVTGEHYRGEWFNVGTVDTYRRCAAHVDLTGSSRSQG